MVEVDVFWSFGIGASFAVAAHRQIAHETCKWWESKYFTYNLLFASIIFAPSGLWLLWINCGWETMYILNKNMPAFIPCLFAMTNVTQAILGYYIAARFIKQGKKNMAHAAWIFGWGMTFLILFVGWRRFLYAGTFEEWNGFAANAWMGGETPWFQYTSMPQTEYPVSAFFSSKIFYSLIGMAVFVTPALVIPITRWLKEGKQLQGAAAEGSNTSSRLSSNVGATR